MGSRIRFMTAVLLLVTTVHLIQALPSFIEEAQLEDLENFEDEIEGIGVEPVILGEDEDLKDVQAETETLDGFSGDGRGGGGAGGRGDRRGGEGGDRRGGEGGDRRGGERRDRREGEGEDRRGSEGRDRRGGEGEDRRGGEGRDRRGGEGEDRRGGEGRDRRGGEGGDRRGGKGRDRRGGEGGDRRGGEGRDGRGGEGECSGEGGDRHGGEGESSGEGGDRRGGEGEESGESGDRRGGEGGDRRGGEGGDRRGGEGEGSGEGGDGRGGEGGDRRGGEGGDRRGGEGEGSGEGGDGRGGEGGDRRGGEGGDRRRGRRGGRRNRGDRRRPSTSCGKTPFKHHLIVGGENAHPHDWPWQVALYRFGRFHCGGSLIEKDWVLTAAHCVFPYPRPNAYTVDVGVHNLNRRTSVRKAYSLSRIIIHEMFDPAAKRADNDIALLQLDGSITSSDEVDIVCLPEEGSRVPVGKQCWGTGWGKRIRGGHAADILQQAMLPIADHNDCSLTNSGLSPPVEEETMMCAGGEGEGGCQIGSGGPLVCKESGNYVLRGIVSWGDPLCRTDFYSVFARVSNFVGWINHNKAITGCGRKPPLRHLVVNGENASPHAWPWQIVLRLFGLLHCGGSLIAKDWVLTAAHCVFDYPGPASYTVVVGAHDRRTPTSVQRSYNVRRIIIYEQYNPEGFVNDVALLQLDGSIVASDKVNVVCLPRQGSRVPVGKQCYITGWGRTGIGMPAADILQQAIMPIADHNICDRTAGLPVIEEVMVCAGGQGKAGGCKGDSGGPLVCEESGRYVVRGIVSWGDGRCRTKFATVFARVSSFTRWINQKMAMF